MKIRYLDTRTPRAASVSNVSGGTESGSRVEKSTSKKVMYDKLYFFSEHLRSDNDVSLRTCTYCIAHWDRIVAGWAGSQG